jgi:hypothetical protein
MLGNKCSAWHDDSSPKKENAHASPILSLTISTRIGGRAGLSNDEDTAKAFLAAVFLRRT